MAEPDKRAIRPLKASLAISGKPFEADFAKPLDISIPLIFDGPQPNTYDVPPASARAYQDGTFVGDVSKGGSCNFEQYALIPHCNGTHTECVGHISYERIPLNSIISAPVFPATLVSIAAEEATQSNETCRPDKNPDDMILTARALREALQGCNPAFLEGLIIRTLPNDSDKKSRRYMAAPPPYFSVEAMQYVVQLGIQHLLLDLPSVDRMFDKGLLTTHHIFWEVEEGNHEVEATKCSRKTITEMIFVPDEIRDGRYLVALNIPNFTADVAPSRPVLYALTPC